MRLTIEHKKAFLALAAIASASSMPAALAQEQSFSDVPSGNPAYEAVEFLKQQGVIAGYADGTYKPDQKVNRAEALKILIAPLVNQQQLLEFNTTVYQDIEAGTWYMPYVEAARQAFGIIDGPPKKNMFYGERRIQKAEFLKMMLLANKAEVGSFGEITLPLSSDVSNPEEWFYPYMRYALSASVTMIGSDGTLAPARELSRGDVALFLHRYLMYKSGRRTQALLTEAETEIQNILESLDKNDVAQAEYASARALLAARGAHASRPSEPIVRAAVKTAESFRALVRAYQAGVGGDFDAVIKLAGDAWNLADQARTLDASLGSLADQVQKTAKSMADSARALKAGQPAS